MKKLHLCFLLVASSLFVWGCGDDSASNANNENGGSNLPPQQGSEIPCDAGNEGLEIKPADSENPRVCTNGTWVEILSSSSSIKTPEPAEGFSSSSIKTPEPAEGSSSSSTKTPEPAEGSSSSSVKAPELAEGSSSSSVKTPEPTEGSSSSAPIEDLSSSSEESKMYLCDDGVTYVLDLANCANSSSSSVIQSSSSTKKPEESSSSVMSSSSSTPIEDPNSSSSSVVSSSSTAVSSSSVQSSSSSSAKSSSSSEKSSSSSVKSSSSSAKSSSSSLGIPFEIYDCSEHKCVTTIYLNPNIEYGEFLDTRDDQVYRTVKIGEQTWMAQNLNYKMEGSRCLCQGGCLSNANSDSLCSVYGRLYTWDAANNACPPGWRLPSDDKEDKDYEILSQYVEENNHGMAVGTSLKAGKNDIWGFSGMFSGYRTAIGAEQYAYKGYYWTNEAKNGDYAFARTLGKDEDFFGWSTSSKDDWHAIRCIKK